jgi:dynactin complex subunit
MAKYGRFDPRNKKSGRNKFRSLERDIRIHDTEKGKNRKLREYEDSDDDIYSHGMTTPGNYDYEN